MKIRMMNSNSKIFRLNGKKPEILERVADLKSQFEKASKELAFPIMFSEEKVTATEAIDLWFNANIFHSDIVKKKRLDQLMSTPDGPFIQFSFKGAILELSKLVISMGSLIQKELLPHS